MPITRKEFLKLGLVAARGGGGGRSAAAPLLPGGRGAGGRCVPITGKECLRRGLGAGGAGLALSSGASASSPGGRGKGTTGNLLRSAAQLPEPFGVPLSVPPVLKPVRTDSWARATTDYYEITQKVGKAEILPGLTTLIWGYDGIFPGPTIESRSSRRVVVRQINELPVPVSTHLHGGRTPPGSDGFPTDLIMSKGAEHRHSAHGPGSIGAVGSAA